MFTVLSTSQIFAIVFGTVLFYGLIVAFVYAKKYWTAPKVVSAPVSIAASSSLIGPIAAATVALRHPSSFAGPVNPSNEQEELEDIPGDLSVPDEALPFHEEQQTTLLKEAERVVEHIQKIVDNITARPANPDEVFTRIHAIVSEYTFFFDTEYYDAINRFIAVTVHRDCDLELSEEDLKALWHAAAA